MTQQRIRIRVKAFDHAIIDNACALVIQSIEENGSLFIGPIPLPTRIEKYCVNRATFVHGRCKEQYEMRIHSRMIDIIQCTPKTVEALSNIDLPAGVDVEIKMLAVES
ncbi:MAG: 30S ribosomal protein S10, small subunit ribosomal protein S10 [Candidatus Peregrinibacteria bacterium GW2011_GWF2_33_10]|nr:MAG: 30S ribosomal protein S10, small subunit ribosomal protein S10 [Candidatus Peregrinibacteria bacterium GW2011_GWF2_33_10]OGJ46138.1 MAG: 30S ribosomal protein S10 [Candidatus Peregrinibacteria bacterium RIFOXYA12_FULL_33_12]OGJ46242.1 MAG: 30S ribosomal protein S10 [Candidatus Peregrinibacteria bacterium RIFOXYA2_FULL_33_21]OGJ51646.1 MAG: 30S ribosomal protein S10 [Candidatus Peregrinibacteria bacterium RIFOXYB2_FULL_33_20]